MDNPILPQTQPALHPQVDYIFPQVIEVTLTLKIGVTTQDERDYYLNRETGAPSVNLLADTFDTYMGVENETLLEINNLKPEQVKAALQAQVPAY